MALTEERKVALTAGIFAVVCPDCDGALTAQRSAQQCTGCAGSYLVRFGHVIRVDGPQVADVVE